MSLRPILRTPANKLLTNTLKAFYSQLLTPLKQYDLEVSTQKIRNDEHQRKILSNLTGLNTALQKYTPPQTFIGKLKSKFTTQPRGIYLYGDVGCGKTMLMDMFYKTTPPHLTKKRVHFHAFMQEVHQLYHKMDIESLCKKIAADAQILCLDEVAVIDVADAMILKKIWDHLYKMKIIMFMTSNRHPDDLYKNGMQRQSFLSAIELIKSQNEVVCLDSRTDYRKLPLPESGNYCYHKELNRRQNHINKWFDFFSQNSEIKKDQKVKVWGREISIPQSANGAAKFTFEELCGSPFSAADYMAICSNFKSIAISDIPYFTLNEKDKLRRFITFLDAAYDNHVHLAATVADHFHNLVRVPNLEITENGQVKFEGTQAGHEEIFAYARALSRLKQMSTEKWLST